MGEGSGTSKAVITFPSELPGILKLSESDFIRELRFLAAAKLYELGHLSPGKAAELADMDRVTFLYELKRVDVPAINLRDEQIEVEIQSARELGG